MRLFSKNKQENKVSDGGVIKPTEVDRLKDKIDAIKTRLWILENPPKYKYGDTPVKDIKIIRSDYSERSYLIGFFMEVERYWLYTVDDGRCMSKLPENKIDEMIEGSKKKDV